MSINPYESNSYPQISLNSLDRLGCVASHTAADVAKEFCYNELGEGVESFGRGLERSEEMDVKNKEDMG